MKPVQTIKILMLFSAWIDFQVCWGLTFGDWSLKFKPPKKKIYNKFYDAKWAQIFCYKIDSNSRKIDENDKIQEL